MRALGAGFAFAARRLGQAALVMFAILIIAFAVRTALGDPLREIVGEAVPEAERAALRHELGLDAPWPVQLGRYLGGAVRGDLGTSTIYKRPTLGVILGKFPASFELVLGASLIVLLFAVYEVWGKAAIVDAHQNDLNRELAQQWAGQPTVAPSTSPSAAPKPAEGKAIAVLFIPRMKKHWTVVQGVSPADIRYAPGHYPDSAMPGEIGNFSVAGHRISAIFWDLDKLKVGDPVVVQTADSWYIYRVSGTEVVKPTAVQVVAPVPNQPGVRPTVAMLTMTTCNPKYNNYQRLVVHGQLDRTQPRTAGDPAELGG